jgi:DNA-binding transcriptional LysR family regulator
MNTPSAIDFRLLLVFEAIWKEGSVSAAGQQLGISQAATSNALQRLRATLDDQLFTRVAGGMAPTPRAIELSGPILASLQTLRSAVLQRPFQPDVPDWTFRLALSDHAVVVILPLLLRILRQRAPDVKLEVESKWNSRIERQLDVGAVDLAIGVIPHLPRRFGREHLFADQYACVMRRDHPLAGGRLTRAAFSQADHLAVRPSLDRAQVVDEALERLGCPRRVVLNLNQFMAVPSVLKETDLIAYMLKSIADRLLVPGLTIEPVPFAPRRTDIVMAWDRAKTRSPANQWIRNVVTEAAKHLAGDIRQS